MKLRTKFQDEDLELGEVVDVDIATMPGGCIKTQSIAKHGGLHIFFYSTKAEFDADWEDAPEEPKGIIKVEKSIVPTCVYIEYSTKEEAEKAVEKLKAWKRLRDKGFRFEGIKQDYTRFNQHEPMKTGRKYLQFNKSEDEEWMKENWADLDLLFPGGEE